MPLLDDMSQILLPKCAKTLIEHLSPEQIIYWKDLKGNIIYVNDYFAKILGAEKGTELIGLNQFETVLKRPEDKQGVLEDDEKVYYEAKKSEFVRTLEYPLTGEYTLKSLIIPVAHPVSGNIYSTLCIGDRVLNLNKLPLSSVQRVMTPEVLREHVNKRSYLVNNTFTISQRDVHTLLLMVAYQPSKHIAEQLNVSVRTIEGRIEKMRRTFNCKDKYELIEFILRSDLLSQI